MDDVRRQGLMNNSELMALQSIDKSYNKFYVPLVWAANMIRDARRRSLITDDRQFDMLIETLTTIRGTISDLFVHQWIIPPLVYTQVCDFIFNYFRLQMGIWLGLSIFKV